MLLPGSFPRPTLLYTIFLMICLIQCWFIFLCKYDTTIYTSACHLIFLYRNFPKYWYVHGQLQPLSRKNEWNQKLPLFTFLGLSPIPVNWQHHYTTLLWKDDVSEVRDVIFGSSKTHLWFDKWRWRDLIM